MTTRTILLALALSLPTICASAAANSQPTEQISQQQAAPQTAQQAPLQQDAKLVCGELSNGVRYMIRPTKEPAGRASIRLYVNNGSLNESKETSGLSHLLEHLVFNGSRHFERGELIPAMQKLGLGFGGDANAYTGLLQTVYKLDLPNLREETVHFAFTIIRDFADGATLSDEAINHERGIVISELKARDSQNYRAMLAMLGQLCNGTRVPDFMPIGLEEVIRDTPCEQIRQFYRDNYLSRRMTVIVTGDFELEEMRRQIEKYFADMADSGTPPARPEIGKPGNIGPDELIHHNEEQAQVMIGLHVVSPWEYEPDTIEQRISDLPLAVACTILNQRLQRMTRRADCPFMAAEVGEQDLFETSHVFSLSLNCSPDNWKPALAAAEQELRRACEHGFSAQEYNEVLTSLLTAALVSQQRWETTPSSAIADWLVDVVGNKTTATAPDEDMRALQAGIAALAEDPDACRRALKAAYDMSRTKIAMTGHTPDGISKSELRAALDAARATEVAPQEEAKLAAFAYDNIGAPGHVTQSAYLEDIDVTTLTLSNGIRVNLKPVTTSKGSISVAARVDGGTRKLMGTPGLHMIAEAVMNQGGLEAHSADDLNRILAGRHAGLSFASEMDRFVISGGCTPEDFELQCQLIAAAIMHPGFRNTGETMLRRRLPEIYSRLRSTPEGAFSYQGARIMHGDDPRFTMPEQEVLEALTTEQVKAAITPSLQKGAMEITIVGDFKTTDIIPVIERTFGAMPEREKEFTPVTPEERTVNFQPWGRSEFLRYPTELDKTIVSHVRPIGNGRDTLRNRRLQVLNSIVREKLFDGIRAELGETYSPSARINFNASYENAATLTTSSAGVKSNRIKVNTAMELILRNLALEDGITDEDFVRAIRPIIASTEKSWRTSGFWQGAISRLQSEPEKLEEIRGLMADLKGMTADEIRTLAREIFGNDNVNRIFTVPENFDETKQ